MALEGNINEIKGNIFDWAGRGAFAFFAWANSAPSGISYWADARFNIWNWINKEYDGISWNGDGYCLPCCNQNLFAIVVGNYAEAPRVDAAYRQAFAHLKEICEEREIDKLVLPPAPAWQETKQIFMDVFMGSNIDIKIVYDDDYFKGEIKDGELDKSEFISRDKSAGALAHKYY